MLIRGLPSADKLTMVGKGKVRVTLYLSKSVLKEVDKAAAVAKVSRSAYIEAVLRQYLRDRERLNRKID